MPLEFLQQTPEQAFRRLESDLKVSGIDLTKWKALTPRQLGEAIRKIELAESAVQKKTTYGKWLGSQNYFNMKMMHEALTMLREHKQTRAEQEVLIPGYTYYTASKTFGDRIEGHRCYFRESADSMWINFVSSLPVEKTLLLLEHGSEEDFRKLYVEMADGRADALDNISVKHITESSAEALAEMEEYANERWNGPWPWETPAPYKLRMMIQDNQEMNARTLKEMQGRFTSLLSQLREGEMNQYEVVLLAREMVDKVQGMIEDLGKLSGEGLLKLKDETRTAFGDGAAEGLDAAVGDQINQAADVLSKLRASMEQTVSQLESGAGVGGAPADPAMPGDLGAAPPIGGDLEQPPMPGAPGEPSPDDLAGVNIDGEEAERPKKEI